MHFASPIFIGHIDMGLQHIKMDISVMVNDQSRHSTANLIIAPMISIRPVDFDACCVVYVLEFFFFLNYFFYFTGTVNAQL